MLTSAHPPQKPTVDLRRRTKQFAIRVIRLYVSLSDRGISRVLGQQLLRSGTSVGAQYHEGFRSRSKAEYVSKLESVVQELEETIYWLELLTETNLVAAPRLNPLLQEADELIAIFVSIVKRVKAGMKASRA